MAPNQVLEACLSLCPSVTYSPILLKSLCSILKRFHILVHCSEKIFKVTAGCHISTGSTQEMSRVKPRGVGDKPMSCKPGVAGSIPGFSIKPLSVEPSEVPVI